MVDARRQKSTSYAWISEAAADCKKARLPRQAAYDEMREAELIPGPNAGPREIEELARGCDESWSPGRRL